MEIFEPERVRPYVADFVPKSMESIGSDNAGNIFEICGIATREMSISSVLAFFLDPEKPHGFGDLFLRNLIAYYCSFDECVCAESSVIGMKFSDIRIDTEYTVDYKGENARVDILITGLIDDDDDFALIIENKIYASEYNPFHVYNGHLRKFAKTILLSPFKGKPRDDCVRLLYSEYFRRIKNSFGNHILSADGKYFFLMQDLFKSMEKVMNDDRIVSLGNRLGSTTDDMKSVIALSGAIYEFRSASKALVGKLQDAVREELKNPRHEALKRIAKVATWGAPYYPGYNMAFILSSPDDASKKEIVVDFWCMNNGWNVVVFVRPDSPDVLKEIQRNNSQYTDMELYGTKRILLEKPLPLNTSIPEVVKWAFHEVYFVAEHLLKKTS